MPVFQFDWSSLSNGSSWPSAQWDVHPSANWHSDFTVDVQGERGRMARGSANGVAAAWINEVTLDDGIIEVDIDPNAATGERANIICFRQSGSIMADWPVWRETGYLINIAAPGWNDGGIELERRDSFTTVAIIAENTNFTMPSANTRFRIVLDGSLIEVYAFAPGGSPTESDLILSHTDSTYTDGQIGIGTATFVGSGAEVRFNNVLVDDLPEDEEHHSGAASATVLINAAGAGTAIEHASGAASTNVTVSVAGSGLKHASGASSAAVSVAASGSGVADVGVVGAGSTTVRVLGSGSGRKRTGDAAHAVVGVTAAGNGFRVDITSGFGAAIVRVDSAGEGVRHATGSGSADVGTLVAGLGLKGVSGFANAAVNILVGSSGLKASAEGAGAGVSILASGFGSLGFSGSAGAVVLVSTTGAGSRKGVGASGALVLIEAAGAGVFEIQIVPVGPIIGSIGTEHPVSGTIQRERVIEGVIVREDVLQATIVRS